MIKDLKNFLAKADVVDISSKVIATSLAVLIASQSAMAGQGPIDMPVVHLSDRVQATLMRDEGVSEPIGLMPTKATVNPFLSSWLKIRTPFFVR